MHTATPGERDDEDEGKDSRSRFNLDLLIAGSSKAYFILLMIVWLEYGTSQKLKNISHHQGHRHY